MNRIPFTYTPTVPASTPALQDSPQQTANSSRRGSVTPAAGAITNPRGRRLDLMPTARKDQSFFSDYHINVNIEGALATNLRNAAKLRTAQSMFREIQSTGLAGPEVDDVVRSSFGLRSDLKYRFVEKIVEGKRVCLLFGYDKKKAVHDIKWVTFDETLPLRVVKVQSPRRNAEELIGLKPHQEGIAVPTRLNGQQQFVLFIRDKETGLTERVTMTEPVIQRAFRSVHRNLTAAARGYVRRKAIQEESQANTPYPDSATLMFATENLRSMFADRPDSIASLDKYSEGRKQRANQWTTYRSTGAIKLLESPVAYLHSFRREGDLFSEMTARRALAPSDPGQNIMGMGHIYRPVMHNMLENFSWLLGLAHHGIELVLTTSLDEQTAVRRKAPAGERTIEKNASALLREIIGLLQDGKYTVDDGDRGKKIFKPTPAAKTATLQSFKNGREKVRAQVDALLATHGLRIEAPGEDGPEVRPDLDKSAFLNQLLMSDLHQADGSFPFLETCLYAGINLLPSQFSIMLDLLGDPNQHDRQGRLVHMLELMVDGLRPGIDGNKGLISAAQALERIDDLTLQKSLFDHVHNKAASMLHPDYRPNFLNVMAARAARNAIAEANMDQNNIGLLEHMAASRAVVRDYAWLPANVLAEPEYSKINIVNAMTWELCYSSDLTNPAAAEHVLGMIERLLTVSEYDRTDWLIVLAANLPFLQNAERAQLLWSFLINARGDVSDPVQRRALDSELACSFVVRSLAHEDFEPARAISELVELGLD